MGRFPRRDQDRRPVLALGRHLGGQEGVNGLGGYDRYFLLPAPDGITWDERTVQGSEGSTVAVADHDHPFIRVFEVYRRNLLYRAVFNERAEGVAKAGRVFLRAGGGQAIGIDFPAWRLLRVRNFVFQLTFSFCFTVFISPSFHSKQNLAFSLLLLANFAYVE